MHKSIFFLASSLGSTFSGCAQHYWLFVLAFFQQQLPPSAPSLCGMGISILVLLEAHPRLLCWCLVSRRLPCCRVCCCLFCRDHREYPLTPNVRSDAERQLLIESTAITAEWSPDMSLRQPSAPPRLVCIHVLTCPLSPPPTL